MIPGNASHMHYVGVTSSITVSYISDNLGVNHHLNSSNLMPWQTHESDSRVSKQIFTNKLCKKRSIRSILPTISLHWLVEHVQCSSVICLDFEILIL